MNYRQIAESINAYKQDNGGTITLSQWKENAAKEETTSYELEDSYQHFLQAMRPKHIWIELDI